MRAEQTVSEIAHARASSRQVREGYARTIQPTSEKRSSRKSTFSILYKLHVVRCGSDCFAVRVSGTSATSGGAVY
jgi:hypothetical protein